MAARALALSLALALAACSRAQPGLSPGPSRIGDASDASSADASTAESPSTPANEGPFFVADSSRRVVPILRADAPNLRYGRLDRDACESDLARRGVPFVRGEPTEGVLEPVRLRGPLHGVVIHTAMTPK